MNAAYFDSSAVLAFLLGQREGPAAFALWTERRIRISSILLRAECLVNIRRHARSLAGKVPLSWLSSREKALSGSLSEVTLAQVDEALLETLESEPALAECRTLDALHLCTALRFREELDGRLDLVTLDERMALVAARLGFQVLLADSGPG